MVIAGVSLNPSHIMENNVPAYAVDLAIALDHITLAAVEEGLGTCWITAFSQEEVKRILGVPDEYKIVALLTIGTPYDDPSIKSRKKLGQLVCYDNF
jgi:nitroreductase